MQHKVCVKQQDVIKHWLCSVWEVEIQEPSGPADGMETSVAIVYGIECSGVSSSGGSATDHTSCRD
jgi:hypothetical protein